jgi:alpha-beta hydrolase superfamily lysophospholipase
MKQQEFSFPSATGVCTISACAYLPETEPETVLVIHHGMAEHRERYEAFVSFLCSHGIAVYMHDMANHGKSNEKMEETGWFGEEDGWKRLIEDYRTVVKQAAEDYPGKKLIVMGHSMGSFLCRLYTAKYPEDGFAGAIFMGTGGANGAAGAGILMAKAIAAVKGKKYKSSLLNKMAFGTYNKRFEGRTDFDWLTRESEIVDRYIADPYCGYLFTVQGMADLISANAASNLQTWYTAVPKKLPILLVSGEEDPVGDYGKGVKSVAEGLRATGHVNVTTKLYPGCRHEVLNETNRQEVTEDLLEWIRTVPEQGKTSV